MFDNKYLAITIGGIEIDLSRSSKESKSQLLAVIRAAEGQSLRLDKALLQNLSAGIATVVPRGLSITIKEVIVARVNKKNILAAGFEIGLSLSDLPLVGDLLPKEAKIDLKNMQLLLSTDALDEKSMEALKQIVPPGISGLPNAMNKGINFSGELTVGDTTYTLDSGSRSKLEQQPGKKGKSSFRPPARRRASVNKGFGPLQLYNIGLDYSEGVFSQVIEAALKLGPLSLGVTGLKIGSPLDHFAPKASLEGLSVLMQAKVVNLGGTLQRTEVNGVEQYSGAVILGMEGQQLEAYGAYSNENGTPSLFVYAILDKPIGGPPFFFVTGLAATFGFNRRLIPPKVDQVRNYPLIKAAMGDPGFPLKKKDPFQILAAMDQVIVPMPGEYFLGVGVKFNSFKVINSFGLLIARFGRKTEFDFIGLSRYVAPDPFDPEPVAMVELEVAGRFDPEGGDILMRGQLTPQSFVFSRNCHLTGGFAIAAWSKGDHAGDFVYSYGGYGNHYQPPAHYPQNIPALGFNWPIDEHLNMKGGGYYTITPREIVAGGFLHAAFNIGWAHANFDLDAHFEFSWKPLHYNGSFHVEFSVGVEVHMLWWTKWLGFSIAANMDVHGPPFGGSAALSLWVCTIHIEFGAPPLPKPLLSWEAFSETFLPPKVEEGLLSLRLVSGLVRKATDGDAREVDIVNGKDFELAVETFIPCTEILFSGAVLKDSEPFGIAPMGIERGEITSKLTIIIIGSSASSTRNVPRKFKAIGQNKRGPVALWGDSKSKGQLVATTPGCVITPASPPQSGKTVSVDRNDLAWELHSCTNAFQWNSLDAYHGKVSQTSEDWVEQRIVVETNALLKSAGMTEISTTNGLPDFLETLNTDMATGTLKLTA